MLGGRSVLRKGFKCRSDGCSSHTRTSEQWGPRLKLDFAPQTGWRHTAVYWAWGSPFCPRSVWLAISTDDLQSLEKVNTIKLELTDNLMLLLFFPLVLLFYCTSLNKRLISVSLSVVVAPVVALRWFRICLASWSRLLICNSNSHVWGSKEQEWGLLLDILSD